MTGKKASLAGLATDEGVHRREINSFPVRRASIGISKGFITHPAGNEPPAAQWRAPGGGWGVLSELRGGIASFGPEPFAGLRRNSVGRPFPRVYHVVKGTSCRYSDQRSPGKNWGTISAEGVGVRFD